MHIVIVGPGIMPIPPKGWGAVESLIWDYKLCLEKRGVQVSIVNVANTSEIIRQINNLQADVVHIQYDNHWNIVPHLQCKNVILTSHYGYLDRLDKAPGDGYWSIFRGFLQSSACIQALSPSIREMYLKHGFPAERVEVIHNGANHELFRYTETPSKPYRSVYLAKIDYRKRQAIYQDIDCIDFVGNLADRYFNTNRRNYLGEWSKEVLYNQLTEYANLVLLSDGEAHPLVCCEALIAGLGLVVSRFAAGNLDTQLPWIDVIPDEKLNDIPYVKHVIQKNQERSIQYRKEIREYALQTFTWEKVVDRYLEQIQRWFFSDIKVNGSPS